MSCPLTSAPRPRPSEGFGGGSSIGRATVSKTVTVAGSSPALPAYAGYECPRERSPVCPRGSLFLPSRSSHEGPLPIPPPLQPRQYAERGGPPAWHGVQQARAPEPPAFLLTGARAASESFAATATSVRLATRSGSCVELRLIRSTTSSTATTTSSTTFRACVVGITRGRARPKVPPLDVLDLDRDVTLSPTPE